MRTADGAYPLHDIVLLSVVGPLHQLREVVVPITALALSALAGASPAAASATPQRLIGLLWYPPIWAAWNRMAQTAALAHATISAAGAEVAGEDLGHDVAGLVLGHALQPR
jgi:hypothetical protein